MTTKSPDPNEVGSIFLSDEAAEQWQSRKAQRGKVSAAADETGHDWADPALARRSMELMANEVWPRIDRVVHGKTP